MSMNPKRGRQAFRRRFVSGSLLVSPCSPECDLQSETKIEPSWVTPTVKCRCMVIIFVGKEVNTCYCSLRD